MVEESVTSEVHAKEIESAKPFDIVPIIPSFFAPTVEPLIDQQVQQYLDPGTNGYARSVMGILAEGQRPELERKTLLRTMLEYTLRHAGVSIGAPQSEQGIVWQDDTMATIVPVAFEMRGAAAQSILTEYYQGSTNAEQIKKVHTVRLYPVITPNGVRALAFVGQYDGLTYRPEENKNDFPLWIQSNSTTAEVAWNTMCDDATRLSSLFAGDSDVADAIQQVKETLAQKEGYRARSSEELQELCTQMNRLYTKDRERKQERATNLEYFQMSTEMDEYGSPTITRAEYRVNLVHNDRSSEKALVDILSVLIQPTAQKEKRGHWWPSVGNYGAYSDTNPEGRKMTLSLLPDLDTAKNPQGRYSRERENSTFIVQSSPDPTKRGGSINISGGNLIELPVDIQVELLSQMNQVIKQNQKI